MPDPMPTCQRFFVTGTDTDVGKTFVGSLLLTGFKQLGLKALGVKPIAAGAQTGRAGTLENSDALRLREHSSIALPYAEHNPICLAAPAAPHLAAAALSQQLDEQVLTRQQTQLLQSGADIVLTEGAGGWLLPLNSYRYLADWVAEQQLPVVLVVGVKLGCLNHAILTVREIQRNQCKLVGWVANILQPDMLFLQENIADLQQRISAPLLGIVPFQPAPDLCRKLGYTLSQSVLAELVNLQNN